MSHEDHNETGNALGTYVDPESGARETALHVATADAFVSLGWKKADKDDKVVSQSDLQTDALSQPVESTDAQADDKKKKG